MQKVNEQEKKRRRRRRLRKLDGYIWRHGYTAFVFLCHAVFHVKLRSAEVGDIR